VNWGIYARSRDLGRSSVLRSGRICDPSDKKIIGWIERKYAPLRSNPDSLPVRE
jgi:hypothetical protein